MNDLIEKEQNGFLKARNIGDNICLLFDIIDYTNHEKIQSACSNLSNFNYKPQTESQQQHLALYMDRNQCSVATMIEVTSRHMKCTHFNTWITAVSKSTRKNNWRFASLNCEFVHIYFSLTFPRICPSSPY